MSRRKRQDAPRRRQPTEIEIAAKAYAEANRGRLPVVPDPPPCELEIDEALRDKVAQIQRRWDEKTMRLRSYGITTPPPGMTENQLLAQLERESRLHIPFVRICQADRELFGWCEWIRLDFTDDLPPDEYAEEAKLFDLPRAFAGPTKLEFDGGPPPSENAALLGQALVWSEGKEWMYARHRAEAPFYAMPAFEYSTDEGKVMRLRGGTADRYITKPRRSFPNWPVD